MHLSSIRPSTQHTTILELTETLIYTEIKCNRENPVHVYSMFWSQFILVSYTFIQDGVSVVGLSAPVMLSHSASDQTHVPSPEIINTQNS